MRYSFTVTNFWNNTVVSRRNDEIMNYIGINMNTTINLAKFRGF
jgi:hypothetical protein